MAEVSMFHLRSWRKTWPPWRKPAPVGDPAAGRHGRAAVIVGRCTWLYFALVLAICVLLHATADRWWPGTLLIYGPRWVWALPLAILVPAAAVARPRVLWLLLVAMILVVGPVMGFCVTWRALRAGEANGPGLRVLTCNTESNSLNA